MSRRPQRQIAKGLLALGVLVAVACNGGSGGAAQPPDLVASSVAGRVPVATGTYCWASDGMGICADAMGVMTGVIPLRVAPGAAITIQGGLAWDSVEELTASVWTASDEPLFEGPSWIAWRPEEDVRSVAIRIEADGLSLAAPAQQGRFVLSLSVNVPQGDVMYGLLLDVEGQESSPGDVLATLGDAFVLRLGGRVAFADHLVEARPVMDAAMLVSSPAD